VIILFIFEINSLKISSTDEDRIQKISELLKKLPKVNRDNLWLVIS
jgi:hypothetical protein